MSYPAPGTGPGPGGVASDGGSEDAVSVTLQSSVSGDTGEGGTSPATSSSDTNTR